MGFVGFKESRFLQEVDRSWKNGKYQSCGVSSKELLKFDLFSKSTYSEEDIRENRELAKGKIHKGMKNNSNNRRSKRTNLFWGRMMVGCHFHHYTHLHCNSATTYILGGPKTKCYLPLEIWCNLTYGLCIRYIIQQDEKIIKWIWIYFLFYRSFHHKFDSGMYMKRTRKPKMTWRTWLEKGMKDLGLQIEMVENPD